MNNIENLLVTISEECAEIQQDVSKALRFGLDNHHPDSNVTNEENILKEYYQLTAVIEYLQECSVLPKWNEEIVKTIKRVKLNNINTYQEVSRKCGTLED